MLDKTEKVYSAEFLRTYLRLNVESVVLRNVHSVVTFNILPNSGDGAIE